MRVLDSCRSDECCRSPNFWTQQLSNFFPYFSLLKDEFPDVRLNIISKLDQVNQVIGIDLLSQSLLPAIVELAEDRHWRNPHYLYRMIVLRAISLLAPVMGSEVACSKLLPVVVTASKDRVQNIKFNVAKVLQSLVPLVDHS
ncbi:hypothetical protein M8C21_001797, partial [Ambrosia artemisiifolia]